MSDDENDTPPTSRREYPTTPMPTLLDPERDEETSSSRLYDAMLFVFVIVALGNLWTVMSLQNDVNAILAYQQEHIVQYQHMTQLLENMQQVKWQMVPS